MIMMVMMVPAAQRSCDPELWHLEKYSLSVKCSDSWEQCRVLH